jgi:hypothetical protein
MHRVDRFQTGAKIVCRTTRVLCVSWIEAGAFWSRRAGKAVSRPVDNNHIGEKIGRDTNHQSKNWQRHESNE